MADLICYIPNHGYVEDDVVWVSWLSGHYYVDDPDTDSFKLTDGADGANVEYGTTVTVGWLRQVDATAGTITIDNLGHVEGEAVTVTANGVNLGSYTVSSGSITLTSDVFTYQVGLPYAMKIKTMRFAVPGADNVITRIKKIGRQTVRYLKAKDFSIGQEVDGIEHMETATATYKATSQDVRTLNTAGHDHDGYSVVKSSSPFPLTVLGIVVDIDITETK